MWGTEGEARVYMEKNKAYFFAGEPIVTMYDEELVKSVLES